MHLPHTASVSRSSLSFISVSVIVAGAFFCALGFSFTHSLAAPAANEVPLTPRESARPDARREVAGVYGKLPLSFAANDGQAGSCARFIARGSGFNLFITGNEAGLALRSETREASAGDKESNANGSDSADGYQIVWMKLSGANHRAKLEALDELPGKLNYFIGSDSRQWRSNIPTYSQVKYSNAYPGIDVLYHGNQQQLEYDFLIAPGAPPRRIKLAFAGARKISIAANGDLILETAAGDVRQQKPIAYQEFNGERRDVTVNYKLKGNQVTFETGAYDTRRPLIIDPVIVYSSFLGGANSEQGLGIAVDAQGSAYLTGSTFSTDFPLSGAFQATLGGSGSSDAFVVKLNPAGTALAYATYLGGSSTDVGNAISVDAQGSAYVVGSTFSNNFPLSVGAFQDARDGSSDAFVTKLSPNGATLSYSTFLGGRNPESAYGVAVDDGGRAYVVGSTQSTQFRTALFPAPRSGSPTYKSTDGAGAWSQSGLGLSSSIVNGLAIDPGNSNTLYAATNFGVFKSVDAGANWNLTAAGNPAIATQFIYTVAVDPSNSAIVYAGTAIGLYKSTDGGANYTQKTDGIGNLPVRSLAIDPNTPATVYAGMQLGVLYKSINGGDNWVQMRAGISGGPRVNKVVVDPTNTATVYLGTSGGMYKTTNGGSVWSSINTGISSNPNILSATIDPLHPATLYCGANLPLQVVYKTTNGGATWSASVNGFPFSIVEALAVDPVTPNTIYAATSGAGIVKSVDGGANWTQSNTNFGNVVANEVVVDRNNPATVYAGTVMGSDVFAVRFNSAGSALEYLLNFGGSETDEAHGVAWDPTGNAYIVGFTDSQNFPVLNAFQSVSGGLRDAFVSKVNPSGSGLVYSTYLGGNQFDTGHAIAVRSGSAYVAGETFSDNFPVFNPIKPGPTNFDEDAFVTKLNPTGASLDFSTCLGGGNYDQGFGLALDGSGNIYATGFTSSTDFPIVAAPQPSPGGVFVSKLNPAGSAFVYSTYLGGSTGSDQGNGIAVDAAGSSYIVGTTSSSDFPTVGAFQSSLKGTSDAFVTKIGPDADVSITKADSRDPVMVGNNLTYTLTVSNPGPEDAADVIVSDTLPAGVAFVSTTSSQGTCSGTSAIACNLGTILKSATATVTVTVTPSSVATITNTATVSSSTPDHNTANNSSTQQTRVSSQPSIAGRATTSTGAGVGTVNMALAGSQTANTTTASNGFYEFGDLSQGGNYNVTPSRQGFVFHPQSISFSNLTADATADFSAVQCLFQIATTSQSFPANGGAGNVTITGADALCPRTAASNVPWITITSGAVGSGSGKVTFSVAPTNIPRSGTLTIAGNLFTVWQEVSPCGAPTFTSAPQFPSNGNPLFIANGDFNGDAKLDVVVLDDGVINVSPERVSIFLGSGAGDFSSPRSVPLGGTPRGIATGDFNNDGKLDVVAVTYAQSANVDIYLGDGAGNLSPFGVYTAGGLPSFVAVGNFNGDANADLAVSNENSHNVSILLGTGGGSFGPTTQLGGTGFFFYPQRVVTGDFNRDAKLDLIVESNNLWLIQGHGDGTFENPVQLGNLSLSAIVVGDFNKDGNSDLAGAAGLGLAVALGNGAGGFGPAINSPVGDRGPSRLVVADFNGDGNADLGTTNSFQTTQDVSVFLGNGTGSFSLGPAYLTGPGPRDLTAGDFNGDGKPDLIVADSNFFAGHGGDITFLAGTGSGGFVGARSFVAPPSDLEIATEDFNGDGKPDLMSFAQFGTFLLLGAAPGEFGAPVSITTSAPYYTGEFVRRNFSTSDFNRDGKPDLGMLMYDSSQSQSHIKVFLNNGSGVFAQTTDIPLGTFIGTGLFADVNGDGNPDFVSTISGVFRLAVRLGDGAGGFGAPTIIVPQINNLSKFEPGDFNGDGKIDLALGVGSGSCGFPSDASLQILLGDGAGGFAAPVVSSFTGFVQNMVAQDLNGDGRSDLVAAIGCTQKLVVLLANAAGDFSASTEFMAGDKPHRLVLADLSGDGKLDLIVSNNSSTGVLNVVQVLTGNGSGGFSAPIPVATEGAAAAIAVADFDGNGHFDLALADLSAGHIGIFLNSCPVTTPTSTFQFGVPGISANEGSFVANITVTRTGDSSSAASVQYATNDGSASERSDYTASSGVLMFAAGETSKSFTVLLTDDALVENGESVLLGLSNPLGASLGAPNNIVLTITDNDTPGAQNPIGDSQFFVRQHYHDFLNREPDAGGLQFWVDQIESCGSDQACREVKRINVSAAFFLSIEFQETGYLAYRMYNAAYGDTTSPNVAGTVPIIRLQEFQPDSQQIGQGVQVGIGNWQQQLEDNKAAYALAFVQRQRFLAAFPLNLTAQEFVNKLDQNTLGVLSAGEKSQLIASLGSTPADAQKRAIVVRMVAEDSDLRQRELNRAFVLMQYYGYLRRNPDDPQDTDFRGWKFWLDKLNEFNGNFVQAEMVKSFLVSGEYRQRFGTP
jgi:uncharacterized repeat protein (TIGR01451 family)